MKIIPVLVLVSFSMLSCDAQTREQNIIVKTGAEVLLDEHISELDGKRIGLIMNPTSRVDGTHMVDTLISLGVNVTALFAAEHGFRGEAGAGEIIEEGIDQQTGLPVFSLYGSTKKPTEEMLEHVDLILFDLPDMGVRFYTYNSTLGLALEAISEQGKELWILDRPNPLGGEYVSGWILREEYKSFVGSYPIPIAYGLTMGEIANMAVGEGWLNIKSAPNYKVIETKGWEREMLWLDTGLEWIPPSPNLPTFEHAFAYTGTVIFEGTNLSEGRGTENPFLTIGSPNLNFQEPDLHKLEVKHKVKLDSIAFTPKAISGKAANPKFEGEVCKGIRISFDSGYTHTNPIELGLDLLTFAKNHTEGFEIKSFANNLFGIDLKSVIEQGRDLPSWEPEVKAFKEQRAPYLLY